MPLYIRGTVSFGTVVATLVATAGDSAFIILALAPEAALYAYGLAFAAAVLFGYAIDIGGLGVGRVDDVVERIGRPMTDGGFATTSVAQGGPSIADFEMDDDHGHDHDHGSTTPSYLPNESRLLERFSHAVHVAWWWCWRARWSLAWHTSLRVHESPSGRSRSRTTACSRSLASPAPRCPFISISSAATTSAKARPAASWIRSTDCTTPSSTPLWKPRW